MSIQKDFRCAFAAGIWLLSATIATPLLPRPRLFAQDHPPATFTSRSELVVLHVVVKDKRGVPLIRSKISSRIMRRNRG